MHQADRFVPICDVGKTSSVILESPPPYRQNMEIDIGTLTGLLGMAGAGEDQLKLSFERQQPIVRAAPPRAGRLTALTKETPFKEEKDLSWKRIVYDPRRQELNLNISYPDKEVKTPIATAINLSRRLIEALSMVPAEKYFTNFLKDLDGKPISGRAVEAAMHTSRIALTALTAPIVYGILQVATNVPRPWETLGILAATNLINMTLDLNSALRLMKNGFMGKNEISNAMAIAIAEKPLRALYPASLIHECLLPTARILTHQVTSPTQLLRAGEK